MSEYDDLGAPLSNEVAAHEILVHPCAEDFGDPDASILGVVECPCGRMSGVFCAVCGQHIHLRVPPDEEPCEHAWELLWPAMLEALAHYWGVE